MRSVYIPSMIVRRTVLIEIAQGKTLMLYSLVVLQQNVSLSLNLVISLGTTSSFWFNFKLIEFKVFFSTSSTSSFHWSNYSKISNYLLLSLKSLLLASEWILLSYHFRGTNIWVFVADKVYLLSHFGHNHILLWWQISIKK